MRDALIGLLSGALVTVGVGAFALHESEPAPSVESWPILEDGRRTSLYVDGRLTTSTLCPDSSRECAEREAARHCGRVGDDYVLLDARPNFRTADRPVIDWEYICTPPTERRAPI